MSHTSSIPLYWRLQKSRYTLTGTRCGTCNTAFFPPRTICPECRRRGSVKEFRFSGLGNIISYTIVRIPPEGFEMYTPYVVAIIELEEGTNISAQVIGDPESISIGKPVRPVFRKIYEGGESGPVHYGLKFELADGSG